MTLELANLEVAYPSFRLGPISTTFESGVTVVLGPSGSGKSSMLSLIAGFEQSDAGTVSLHGQRLDGRPPEDRGIGLVFQNHALFPHLDVTENLSFGATGDVDVEKVCELLEIGDLLDRAPATLSGGEKQRVALARTLVADPDALLLDEPLASLDAPIRRRLRFELRDVLSDLDIPVVYVTHDRDEAAVVGDRLAVLFDGELVQRGALAEVFDAPKTPRVAEFLGMENVFSGVVVDSSDDTTTVRVGDVALRASGTTECAEVTVGFRPTAVELVDGGEPPNALDCRVRRVVDQHTDTLVGLSCEGLGDVTASVDRDRGESLAPGRECIVAVAPERVHTMPPSD